MSVRNFIELNGLWTQELHFASVTHSDTLGPEIDPKSSHRMSRGSAVATYHSNTIRTILIRNGVSNHAITPFCSTLSHVEK